MILIKRSSSGSALNGFAFGGAAVKFYELPFSLISLLSFSLSSSLSGDFVSSLDPQDMGINLQRFCLVPGLHFLLSLIIAPGTEHLFGGGPKDVAKNKLRKLALT